MIPIYEVQPAQVATATWLRSLIQPAAQIARLDPFPVEIRPMGKWSGWAQHPDDAPDFRVCISTRIYFFKRSQILSVYLHECAHQLLNHADPQVYHGHDAAFFALNYLLLARLDACTDTGLPVRSSTWVSTMSLYDLSDPPEHLAGQADWQTMAMAWSMATARELHTSEHDAHECARLIAGRYKAWCSRTDDQPQRVRGKEPEPAGWVFVMTGAVAVLSALVFIGRAVMQHMG